MEEIFFFQTMPLLKICDDKDGNGGGQMQSDDLRTMTTIGQRTLRYITDNDVPYR